MKKIQLFLALCFCVFFNISYAQNGGTGSGYGSAESIESRQEFYKEIKQFVETSPEQYADILRRFSEGDETLPMAKLKYAYYGFVFTQGYDGDNNYYTEMYQAYQAGKEDIAKSYAKLFLKQNPVSLELLFRLASLEPSADNINRFVKLVSVIMKSGDGKTPETEIKVNRIGDEYRILEFIYKAQNINQFNLGGGIDRFDIVNGEGEKQTVYFDHVYSTLLTQNRRSAGK